MVLRHFATKRFCDSLCGAQCIYRIVVIFEKALWLVHV